MGREGDYGLPARRPEAAPLSLASRGPAADEACAVRVRHEPGYVLVTVIGDVDYATVAGLRERLFALAATGRPLVVDLDLVSFIDAAGLGALAGAARRAAAHGVGLHVVCARPRTRRLFHVTGLDQAISLAGRLAEALRKAPGPDVKVSLRVTRLGGRACPGAGVVRWAVPPGGKQHRWSIAVAGTAAMEH